MRSYLAPKLGACLLLFLLSGTVNAQNNRAPSLEQAIALSLQSNPQLLAFGYQLDALDGRVLQAGLPPRPTIGLMVEDVFGSGNFQAFDRAQTTLSIAWVLEGQIRPHRIEAARMDKSLSVSNADILRLDIAAETARLFLDCLAYQARLETVGQALTLAREAVEALTKRMAAGRSSEADLARARVDLARHELQREDLKHRLQSAVRLLAAQWGEREPTFQRVAGELTGLPQPGPFDDLRAHIDRTPDIARFLSEERLKESQWRLAKSESKPAWELSAGLRRFQNGNDTAFLAGLSLPLSLSNRNQGRIAETRAGIERAQANAETARLSMETLLFVLYQDLQHARHSYSILHDSIVPNLEQALTATRRGYQLGRYSYFEWRALQAELLQARRDRLEANINAHRNLIEIERLTGMRLTQTVTTP